jgi:metal-responsive CopG/Arc/MetJ family transcriptional regulator
MKKRGRIRFHLCLGAELMDRIGAMAEEQYRTRSNLVELLLIKALKEEAERREGRAPGGI